MSTDIFAERVAATGTAVAFPTRVRAISMAPDGVGVVSLTLRDGGASGTTRLVLDSNSTTIPYYAEFPGNGIRFSTDVHVTITNASAVTVFYG